MPSRWLLRLDTVMRATGLEWQPLPSGGPLAWQALLDRPERRIVRAPPAPRPPLAARPRAALGDADRDLDARSLCHLCPQDPAPRGARPDRRRSRRGRSRQAIHAALDSFLREPIRAALPGDAEARLLALGARRFGAALERPGVRAFWWPRFERIARWFIAEERERRRHLALIRSEIEGRLELARAGGAFTLTAKRRPHRPARDGGLVLVDYKTGAVPSGGGRAGFSPQLPLEAAIAEAGGFDGVGAEARRRRSNTGSSPAAIPPARRRRWRPTPPRCAG